MALWFKKMDAEAKTASREYVFHEVSWGNREMGMILDIQDQKEKGESCKELTWLKGLLVLSTNFLQSPQHSGAPAMK